MRRAVRIAGWSLAGLVLLVLLCVAALIVAGNTGGGRRLLERATAQLSAGRVRIAGLGGRFPSRIDIARVRLSDASGVWLSAERISLHWSPWALLAWDLHLERFAVGRVEVLRRPVAAAARSGGASTHLPAIDIDRLRIHTLVLEPATAGALTRLTVQGELHYRSMRNARARLVVRRTNGMGLYRLRLRAGASALNASLELDEPAGGPLEHWLDLPGLGALRVTASLAGPRRAAQLRFSARAGKLHAAARGTIDLNRPAADLTYSIASPAMTPRPGLAWRRIALAGRWHGPLAAAEASAALDVQGLRLSDGVRLGALEASLAANGRVLTVRATARRIRLPGSHPRLLASSPLNMEATVQLRAAHRPLQLTVTDRLFDLRARALTAGARSATFALRLPDVSPLAALYRQDIRGSMRLSGELAQSGASTRLAVNGSGRLHGAGLAARLLGGRTRLRFAADATPTRIDVRRAVLSGRALSVSASGSAERNAAGAAAGAVRALHARWRVALPDLTRISRSTLGSLELSGTAAGAPHALSLKASARARLSVRGSPTGTFTATLRAHGLPSVPRVVLRARGVFDGAPLRLDASLARRTAHAYHLDVRRIEWKSVRVDGELAAARPNLASAHGQLRLSIGRLADLQPLVGTALAGTVDGSVALSPLAGRASLRIELTGRHMEAGGLEGAVRLSALGPIDALRVRLAADSPAVRGAPASLTASARLDAAVRTLDLLGLDARYRGQTLRLLSPSRVTFTGGLEVRNLRLGVQRTVIALDGRLSPTLDVRASVHHLDAGLVDVFAPALLARGTLDAETRLTGSRAAPSGRVSLEIAGMEFAGAAVQGLPAVNVRGFAQLHGGVADISAALAAGPESHLALSGRAPLDSTGPLALRLTGKMDAALMNAILEARGERAAGTLSVDATVHGSMRAPQIRGDVELANGDLRDYAEGVHIGDINARLVGEHGVLRIASLTARAGPGRLSAAGTLGVLQPQMPIDVSLSARSIEPITNDILTANLDADVRVAGTLRHRLQVTGTIHINRASISIPSAFPPNVATLEVIRAGATPRPARTARRVIGLGLALSAPQSIFVRGRGLDAQLGGNLRIAGTTAQPRVTGAFSLVHGTFSLAGTSLTFTRGRVGFNGEGLRGGIDPTLDFAAQTSVMYISPTTVTLRITGFAKAPNISLSSTPALPQDDLLALLLFGKPASELNPYELAETGAALVNLSGLSGASAGSLNPLTWIRRYLGLSTLSVSSAAPQAGAAGSGTQTGGTSVTAGRYISNKVYVAASHTTLGSSQIRVDVTLTPHLKLETRLGNGTATTQGTTPQNDPGSSIGLSYQLRY